jgi:peptidyl-prolyl cis-trans isomerase C
VRKDIVIAIVAVVIVAAVAFGLAAVRPNLPATPSSPFTAEAGKPGVKPAADDKVVMHVNGQPVTEREFALFIQSAPAEARPFYASPAGRRALADEVVKLKVLEQEAGRLGLADDAEMRTQLAMARAQIAASRALEKLADRNADTKIRAEYEKEKANAVSLRHILIAYEGGGVPARGGAQPPSAEAAMSRARDIHAKLKGGADFAATAKAESDDTESGARGGMLGPARPDMLPPDIQGVVSKLQPGQMSEPVRTQFGIHIFKVEQPTLEDLAPMLRQRVRQQAAQEEVQKLQEKAKVDYDSKFFPPAPVVPQAPAAAPSTGTNG